MVQRAFGIISCFLALGLLFQNAQAKGASAGHINGVTKKHGQWSIHYVINVDDPLYKRFKSFHNLFVKAGFEENDGGKYSVSTKFESDQFTIETNSSQFTNPSKYKDFLILDFTMKGQGECYFEESEIGIYGDMASPLWELVKTYGKPVGVLSGYDAYGFEKLECYMPYGIHSKVYCKLRS